jgi:8-oxo-dGTP diphosphatase
VRLRAVVRRCGGCRVRSLPRMGTAEFGSQAGVAATQPLVPCVGAVVHDADGRLLLIRRGHAPHEGLWSVPGGRVEPGESPEAAVVREVREETGLRVRAGAAVGRVRIPAGGVVYEVTDLACTLEGSDQRPVAGDDASDVMFADAAALERLSCTPRLVETLGGWGVLPR